MALTGAQIGDVVACGAKVQEVEQGSVETIRFFVVCFFTVCSCHVQHQHAHTVANLTQQMRAYVFIVNDDSV